MMRAFDGNRRLFFFNFPYKNMLWVLIIGEAVLMHLSMFSPQRGRRVGRDYPRELDDFEKLGYNSLPM